MFERAHVGLLRLYRRLPRTSRRLVVRTVSPSFTVGSMCVIERDDGALLLVRHVYRSRWGVPGGLLKRGEAATSAARREVLEEVGLAVDLVGEPAVVVDATPQRVDVVFRARPAPGADPAAADACSPEIEEAQWFPADELPELQHETATALVALARSSSAPQAPALVAPSPPGRRSDPVPDPPAVARRGSPQLRSPGPPGA